jgi:hypothetical protein
MHPLVQTINKETTNRKGRINKHMSYWLVNEPTNYY